MIRSVEFDLFTKIEPNARFASRAGMFAKSKRIADQRAAVKAVLVSTFGAVVPPRYVTIANVLQRNPIRVKLTRIAPGRTADAWENLRAALKAVKDEVARWCGFDDKEGAGITWLDPGQESQGQHVYRVRVEITDASPGQDRIVCLAETSAEGRAAKSRVKRQVKEAAKMNGVTKAGRVLTYQLEAGARAASSAARGRAEQAFSRLTGKPTVEDLARAGARVLLPMTTAQAVKVVTNHIEAVKRGDAEAIALDRDARVVMQRHDPGEERPARDLAPCTTCGAAIGEPCRPIDGVRPMFGVHTRRALAAGIIDAKLPPRAPTNGHRRIVPFAQAPLPLPAAYVRLPWHGKPCEPCADHRRLWGTLLSSSEHQTCPNRCQACHGVGVLPGPVTRDARHDGEDAPAQVTYTVPAEHGARFGDTVTLTRRPFTSERTGACWLYE